MNSSEKGKKYFLSKSQVPNKVFRLLTLVVTELASSPKRKVTGETLSGEVESSLYIII